MPIQDEVEKAARERREVEAMRRRSGSVDGGPFAAILYTLIRDGKLAPSDLEEILDAYCLEPRGGSFTNGWLGAYANDVVTRILEAESRVPRATATPSWEALPWRVGTGYEQADGDEGVYISDAQGRVVYAFGDVPLTEDRARRIVEAVNRVAVPQKGA